VLLSGARATGGFMTKIGKALAVGLVAVIVLLISFYGTTLAMSYLYTVDFAPIAF
jgi:hypothetical protein